MLHEFSVVVCRKLPFFESKPTQMVIRVGIAGYGHLGAFLASAMLSRPTLFQLVFVWNRTPEAVLSDPTVASFFLDSLDKIVPGSVDLIIEVAHPVLIKQHGLALLKLADLLIGSPTAFADPEVEQALRAEASSGAGY